MAPSYTAAKARAVTIEWFARRLALYWERPTPEQILEMLPAHGIDPSSLTAEEVTGICPDNLPRLQGLRTLWANVREWLSGGGGERRPLSDQKVEAAETMRDRLKAEYDEALEKADAEAKRVFDQNMEAWRLFERDVWQRAVEAAHKQAMEELERKMEALRR